MKKNIRSWIIFLILITSLILNVYQYNTIQKYQAQMDSINDYFLSELRFLSQNIKEFNGSVKDLVIFSSTTGSVYALSLACKVNGFYKNHLLASEVFTELNNMFWGAPKWLDKIKENRYELGELLKNLLENPNDKESQEKLFELIKRIEV
ncbi:MAG: hypothetical protein ACPL3A_10655 [Thermoanaerobacteraceae bacterium]